MVRFGYHRDWSSAEAEFRRGIALDSSSPEGYEAYSRFLLAMGRRDESLEANEEAVKLSPTSFRSLEQLGWYQLYSRHYDQARETLARVIALDSTAWRPRFYVAQADQALGRYDDAITHLQAALQQAPGRAELRAALGQVYARSGRIEEARTILTGMLEQSQQRYVSPYLVATVQAALGQRRQAFASLTRALTERSQLVGYLGIDPRLDSLRTDPRFAPLLRRLRLP
jgi:tetratricopeptide (TPR) repeat protein